MSSKVKIFAASRSMELATTIAEEFAKNDPYVKNGLITEWSVRPWTVVVGGK